jgi:hypothetical protein
MPTRDERIAILEAEVRAIRAEQAAMAADVRAIRDVMLTEDGTRKGYWKVIAAGGSVLAALGAFATFWHQFGDWFRR